MIYAMYPDVHNFLLMNIDADEAEEKLGDDTTFHFDARPKYYLAGWVPLEMDFYDADGGTKQPDISVHYGKMYLNTKAYMALRRLIGPHGEFLPVTHKESNGYLFNTLSIADDHGGLDSDKCIVDDGDLVSIGFHEHRLSELSIFRTAFDHYQGHL